MEKTILIVDDSPVEREYLSQIFCGDYKIVMANDGKEAIIQLSQHYQDIVIILLDLIMPTLNGYQVLQVLKSHEAFRDIPVVMVTANSDLSMETACYTLGAVSVIHKPFLPQAIQKQITNIIDMYEVNLQLKSSLNEQQQKLNQYYNNLTDAISNLIEFRGMDSGTHIERLKALTGIMANCYAKRFPESNLTSQNIEIIMRASVTHDIGKILIPDQILLKPASLTDAEFKILQMHTTKGCEILQIFEDLLDKQEYKISYDICRHHHERYDGNGYPDGLKGDEIPLSAQIVCIIDVYDALVSKRVYKQPYSKQKAYKMITGGECGEFSPKILTCFDQIRDEIETFSDSHR